MMLPRFLVIPTFLLVMYLVFAFAMQVADLFQDLLAGPLKSFCTEGMRSALLWMQAPDWLARLLVFGLEGLSTTLSFIPVIAVLFFALSFLGASGYMARVSFVMDRLMQHIGLPGKSFVPMILGFGCNVPAVMAARTIDNPRERILTVLMTPFMSCGARLAIYALFAAAFFPHQGQNIIFGLYIIGILVALITGFVLKKTVLVGARSAPICELPAYRWPCWRSVCRSTISQVQDFVLKAGALIVPLCILIGGLGMVPDTKGGISQPYALATMGRTLSPLFAPMGIQEENWPATVALLSGMLAKEVVVGTLSALYTEPSAAKGSSLETQKEEALADTPVFTAGALGIMVERFGSTAAAFAYLLFVLLYFPCVSVVASIARELNRSWAVFSVVWTTGIAYVTAVLFYQIATFSQDPSQSMAWIIGILVLLGIVFYALRKAARLQKNARLRAVPTRILLV